MSFRISVQQNMMRGNDECAKRNRNMLAEHNVFTTNMLSSPGAGKTSLRCRGTRTCNDYYRIGQEHVPFAD